MSTEITVTMTPRTVQCLIASASRLHALHGVVTSDATCRPVVWWQADAMPRMTVGWSREVGAFTASSPVAAGTPVRPGFTTPVPPGELLQVGAGGIGEVLREGYPGVVAFLNTTTSPFVVGVAAVPDGSREPRPICATTLHGRTLQTLRPAGRVLLVFASGRLAVGTVVGDDIASEPGCYSPALLVDVDPDEERQVAYDIDEGWSTDDDGSWATPLPATADLLAAAVRPTLGPQTRGPGTSGPAGGP